MKTTATCECVMVSEGRSGDELCEERLIGEVRGPRLRAWQRWTATEAAMWGASAQEVERHVGNPSTGPTLRTETEMLLWSSQGGYSFIRASARFFFFVFF